MADNELTSIVRSPNESFEPSSAIQLTKQYGLSKEVAEKIAEIPSQTQVNILSDLPASEDALGVRALVRTLSDVLLSDSTQTPITIGVDGKWGTGKTSILRMIEERARLLDFPCIWLNAWNFESTENLWAAVVSEVTREFKARTNSSLQTEAFFKSVRRWLANATMSLADLAGSLIDSPTSVLLKQSAGVVKASRDRHDDVEAIAELVSTSTFDQSFTPLVQSLIKSTKHENGRLIIFIDDLDRALPDQVADIMKNLKLVLENPQCVFVLAMDMNIVARAIESFYRNRSQNVSLVTVSNYGRFDGSVSHSDSNSPKPELFDEGFGDSYLEKLIQIHVEVPSLTRAVVDTYLDQLNIVPEVKDIVHWAPDEDVLNPRRLKRYINWLSISLQLIASARMPFSIRNNTALQAMALKRDYPEIYEALLRGNEVMGSGTYLENARHDADDDLKYQFEVYLRKISIDEICRFDEFVKQVPLLNVKHQTSKR